MNKTKIHYTLVVSILILLCLFLTSCTNYSVSNEKISSNSIQFDETESKVNKNSELEELQKKAQQYSNKKEFGYEYDDNTKTLFVFGKGKMSFNGKFPWMKALKGKLYLEPKNLVICSGISSIEDRAFSDDIEGNTGNGENGLGNLKSVIISDSVRQIGKYAFYNCNNLETINIPDSVKEIGEGAFWDCDNLNNVTIPGSVEKIPKNLFFACRKMESVTIENGVKYIGQDAFSATYLKSLNIPNSVTTIESGAFSFTHFSCVEIPDSVVKIGDKAFGHYAYDDSGDKIKDFIISGTKNSEAEKYAKENGFKFISLKKQ